jgi:hypothetical protein
MNSFQVKMLWKEHFKPIHAQMKHEEQEKISLMDIPNLMDVPKYKAKPACQSTSMILGPTCLSTVAWRASPRLYCLANAGSDKMDQCHNPPN